MYYELYDKNVAMPCYPAVVLSNYGGRGAKLVNPDGVDKRRNQMVRFRTSLQRDSLRYSNDNNFTCQKSFKKSGRARRNLGEDWCRGVESNHRHCALQAHALPLSYLGL
jgi:hypothetical protein